MAYYRVKAEDEERERDGGTAWSPEFDRGGSGHAGLRAHGAAVMAGGMRDRAVTVKLSEAPRELVRELRAEYLQAARRAAGKTQDRIRSASSRHPGGLRERLAGTVTASVQQRGDGLVVRISSVGSRMPPGEANLNAYSDGSTRRPWRHPVFGHDRWETQEWPSARGWFTGTLRGERERLADAARQAVDGVAARLER
jgi:hypothetical protein